jgi:hypothetical protein
MNIKQKKLKLKRPNVACFEWKIIKRELESKIDENKS